MAFPVAEIIAHRGASEDAPENTLAAFRLAFAQGADGIEGDFHLTRDGHVVCLHDPRPRDGGGPEVSRATLAELQSLDVGAWKGKQWAGERIPSLEAVLALLPAGKRFLVEVKSGPEILPPLKKALARSPVDPGRMIIISFNEEVVAEAGKRLPEVNRYLILDRRQLEGFSHAPERIATHLRALGAGGLSVEAVRRLDAGFVRSFDEAGLGLNVWTVDRLETARRLLAAGIRSLSTNRPGRLRQDLGLTLNSAPPVFPA